MALQWLLCMPFRSGSLLTQILRACPQVVSFLQNSGALTASKTLVQTALKHYALSRVRCMLHLSWLASHCPCSHAWPSPCLS